MKQPAVPFLISVIIPAYNIEKYFDECMASLEEQELGKGCFEVVVVDDGSTDNTLERARGYKTELNLRVEYLDVNSGPGVARNRGLEVSQGKYIVFLDGDDLLASGALSRLSDAMEKEDIDLFTFNWTYFSDTENIAGYVPRRRDLDGIPVDRDALIAHYLGMNMDGSVIYSVAKKALFDKYQIAFLGGYHEDMPVLFQLYYAAKTVRTLNEVLYIKRNVANSIVNTLRKKHVQGYLNAWPTILKFLRRQKIETDRYMPHYIRGMSGHVCTLINKCQSINPDDYKSREQIYGYILEAIEQDINLRKPYALYFPDVTAKDKVTQLFFAHMLIPGLPLSERSRNFDQAYFLKINNGEYTEQG